jgi:CDP-paratose 2-epimerase
MKMSARSATRNGRSGVKGSSANFEKFAPLTAQACNSRAPGPRIGIVQSFRLGDYESVEEMLANVAALGITDLRTPISWAELQTMEGEQWYKWLIPRLANQFNVVPCVLYTPPAEAVLPRTSAPPRDPKAYADFLDVLITRFGKYFEWIQLWDQPNKVSEWDRTLDPDWNVFCHMIGGAAYWMQQRGKRTLLAGMSPFDPNWLKLMFDRGVMQYIDAVGIHGYPGACEAAWEGWPTIVRCVQQILDERNSKSQIWISETGYSTWRHDEYMQIQALASSLEAPVERVYWFAARDLDPEVPSIDGFHSDDRDYHFGLRRSDGSPKLLARLWETGGLDSVWEAIMPRKDRRRRKSKRARPVVITGGAGFIGTNLAARLMSQGQEVLLYDNLSRPGVERNLRWLQQTYGNLVDVEVADVRNAYTLRRALRNASGVFHFAAQVAVTTSLSNPAHDFEVNALGTLNLLEALRNLDHRVPVVFTSTNKVYGGLDDIALECIDSAYQPVDAHLQTTGIGESRPLDLHSPYGCSKGSADQYLIDYARTFGVPAVVFRMSCIYGPHQMGTEDQGWVAHFLIRALENQPITLYGDGMQVRDVLYVDDLVDAFELARANVDALSGQAFNIGGGPQNTLSLLRLLQIIEEIHGHQPSHTFEAWRPGDQRYYVSDTSKFQAATGWKPKVKPLAGVQQLYNWLKTAQEQGSLTAASPISTRQPRKRVAYKDRLDRTALIAEVLR